MRADPLALPGGAELGPLTVRRIVGGRTQAEKDAYTALREILQDGDLAFRHWRDGWIDDAGIQWRRFTGLGYLLRHSAGRLNWPLPADHPAAPVLLALGVRDLASARWRHAVLPGQHRRRLEALVRETDRADRLYHRALRAADFLADQGGGLPADAIALLHIARLGQVEAHGALAEAREQAAAELDAVGSYLHQVDRTLGAAEAARPRAPGEDPLPPTAEFWLREIARELDAARKRLDRLHPGPERDEALAEARLSLERYAVDRDYAWETALYRTTGGWSVMETGRVAAKKLRAAHPDLFRETITPSPVPLPVIPHVDRIERPYGDDLRSGPGMAAATRRGLGNRTNQDAATLVTLPNGDRVAAVVDGVFSYPDSQLAANRFAAAFHAELNRSDRGIRTPTQALHDAHDAGLTALAGHYTPETGHGAVAYVAAHHAADGTITIFHVGTARAYYLPFDTTLDGEQRTTDDSRGGHITDAGVMTRWAGSDYRPEPTITRFEPGTPGVLVLATDGLWRYLDGPAELTEALGTYTHPTAAAARLADAAHLAGGRDDLTVAVMQAIAPTHGIGPATMSLGGGPVAVGGMDGPMRDRVIGRLPNALADARPLSGEEFPHLARGPPEAVARVRIADADLGAGGGLLAFGWRHAVHAPDGVIVVPAAVARTIERLVAADPAFAGWWERLLRHELEFHIDGDEHTGHRHDAHAGGLATEYVEARALLAAAAVTAPGTGELRTGRAARFRLDWRAIFAVTAGWALLEVLVNLVPGLRGQLPEPFDLFSHAKNLKGGAVVAVAALALRTMVERLRAGVHHLTRSGLRSFHRWWLPGVLVVAAAINAVTETQWGLDTLGYRLFPHTTPDLLDLVYSVGLAVRLLHGATATPYVARRDQPAVDVGAPLREAVTAAFARLLPEPLRQALGTDRRHLHEIRESLRNLRP